MYHLYRWTRHSIGRNYMTRHYEPLQPHLLMALARRFECQTFLDVGANVGAYAIMMSGVPSVTAIHAFEASPETFAELRQNVELNGLPIQIHNKAVSDKEGVLRFGIVGALSGANSLVDTSLHRTFERQIEVAAAPLDKLLSIAGQRLCVKIDVEGHEPQVLAGMATLLERNEAVLQLEDYGAEPGELDGRLASFGLEPLFRVGVDRFFSSIKPRPSDRELIGVFEQATNELVETRLADLQRHYAGGEPPLDIGLGATASLRLRGRPASMARALRRRARAVLGR